MIRFIDVTKHYGKTLALDKLSLVIPQGAILGLLGPNGAGKSTLIHLLMGFIFPDAGQLERGAWTPAQIGYVPERPSFPLRCPADESLIVAGELSGMNGAVLRNTVNARLTQVGLQHAAHWNVNQFSKGMLQRLALAHALLSDPALFILDEPMSGLDPAAQKEVREIIKSLRYDGKTVLFSTHRLDDIEDVCTHVAILKRGRLVRAGTMDEILTPHPQIVITVNALPASYALAEWYPGIAAQGNTITLNGDAVARKADVIRRLLGDGVDIQSLTQQRVTLEQVYLEAQR
jgi:ABC-2 type transport system ATP-binding protein